jgi:hypothetical protein
MTRFTSYVGALGALFSDTVLAHGTHAAMTFWHNLWHVIEPMLPLVVLLCVLGTWVVVSRLRRTD